LFLYKFSAARYFFIADFFDFFYRSRFFNKFLYFVIRSGEFDLFDGVWLLMLGRSDEKFRGIKDPEEVSSVRRMGPKRT
jgi:hypothetical protein